MDLGEGGDGPEAKRRKAFTKRETLQKLEELGDNVSKAVSEMVSDLSPFDVNGDKGHFAQKHDVGSKTALCAQKEPLWAIGAEKQPAERPNNHLPENQRYPELPQDMGDM